MTRQDAKAVALHVAFAILTALLLWGSSIVINPLGRPVSGELNGTALVLRGRDLDAPDPGPEQTLAHRNGSLTIRVLPDQPAPSPADRGVRILLTDERLPLVNNRAVVALVRYEMPHAAAASLALSLQGIGPAEWVAQALSPEGGEARFELSAQTEIEGIGLRAIARSSKATGAVTITEIKILPASTAPTSANARTDARLRPS